MVPIEEMKIDADYCFGPEGIRFSNLKPVNFIFAPNGSGKSTISRLLAQQPQDAQTRENWPVAPCTIPIRVFNEDYKAGVLKDYVDGIFTLGSESQDINNRISTLREEQRKEEEKITDLKKKKEATRDELQQLDEKYSVDVFDVYKDLPRLLQVAIFEGYRNDKKKFLAKAVEVHESLKNHPRSSDWSDLKTKADSLRSGTKSRTTLPTLQLTSLLSQSDLKTIGSEISAGGSGRLAQLIETLDHAPWVDQGRQYVGTESDDCPFCQQGIDVETLKRDLDQYFTNEYDQYLRECQRIDSETAAAVERLELELSRIKKAVEGDDGIDPADIFRQIDHVRAESQLARANVSAKLKDPSEPLEIKDITKAAERLNELIEAENSAIVTHNDLVKNLDYERENLTKEGWANFVTSQDAAGMLNGYAEQKRKKTQRVSSFEVQLQEVGQRILEIEREVEVLRESVSDTTRVAENINTLLKNLGFQRFKLQVKDDDVAGGYEIVRKDGSTAHENLSEGERSFLTFAYFWESLFGSFSSATPAEDVVVVFDDPVSSLDSDTLYIVAAHMRKAAQAARSVNSNIRQLIVLTHNTQFHHEASYTRTSDYTQYRFFRLIKDPTQPITRLQDDGSSPRVRGNYHLLWNYVVEAARADDLTAPANVGLYNVVRRIIEGYFTWVSKPLETPLTEFSGSIERRLIDTFDIWTNSGSHTITNDFDQTVHPGSVVSFLTLFKRYFDCHGHSAHFEMMVRSNGGADLFEPGMVFDTRA